MTMTSAQQTLYVIDQIYDSQYSPAEPDGEGVDLDFYITYTTTSTAGPSLGAMNGAGVSSSPASTAPTTSTVSITAPVASISSTAPASPIASAFPSSLVQGTNVTATLNATAGTTRQSSLTGTSSLLSSTTIEIISRHPLSRPTLVSEWVLLISVSASTAGFSHTGSGATQSSTSNAGASMIARVDPLLLVSFLAITVLFRRTQYLGM